MTPEMRAEILRHLRQAHESIIYLGLAYVFPADVAVMLAKQLDARIERMEMINSVMEAMGE